MGADGAWRRAGGRLRTALFTWREAPGAHRVAARVMLVLLVALSTLLALGRIDLAPYASFGAFASLYGGALRRHDRWPFQARQGVLLTLAVTSGCLVATTPIAAWLVIPVAGAWTALAAALSDRYRWRPPGPLFFVFAVATSAAIPVSATTVGLAALACAATATLAVLLGAAEVAIWGGTDDDHPAWAIRWERWRVQAVRCSMAVMVAGLISTLAGIERPYWAMIAAVVPLTVPGLGHQLTRALHRVLGTLVGVLLAGVLLALQLPGPAVVVAVVLLQGAAELLVVRHYGLALVFITPLALLLGSLGHTGPVLPVLEARLVETLIGTAVGALAAFLTRERGRLG
ncbi:MAG: FUSC family protein [Propionicimonas sp.]|uniref:FUSC family protein n=1 Tax=Propionicimonas sp. TaxID=1955623 RepID=UPI003D0FD354